MTLAASSTDHNRTRVGLVVLVLGISFLLWSWGHWVYRTSKPQAAASAVQADTDRVNSSQSRKSAVLLPKMLAWGTTIVMVGLFGSYVLVRVFRRYRDGTGQGTGRSRSPTVTEDLWAMHKVPDCGPPEEQAQDQDDT